MNFKNIIPYILLIASGGLIYVYMKNKGDKDKNITEDKTEETTIQSTPKAPQKTTINLNKVLKNGSKGLEVKLLQVYLNQYLKARKKKQLDIDGGFGKDTLIALNWLFKRKETTLQQIKSFSIAQGLDWELMKKIAKQILAQKQVNVNLENF